MTWRVAHSLDQLLYEINAAAPGRGKASDGSIGDEDHQSRDSDHNPHCCGWVVTARDFTHDPGGGFDSYLFADWLRHRCAGDILINGQRETRVKYIISNRRITSPERGWAWDDYTGDNPHTHHCHVSVDCTGEGGPMDDTTPWGWPDGGNDMSINDQVPATGGRDIGVCLSDIWNAVAMGASGYDPAVALHINAQLNAIQNQVNDLAATVAAMADLPAAAAVHTVAPPDGPPRPTWRPAPLDAPEPGRRHVDPDAAARRPGAHSDG